MSEDRGVLIVEEGGVITLPPDLLVGLGWRPDDDLTITVIENGFTIERAKSDTA